MSDYLPTFVTQQLTARLRGAMAQHDISQAQLAILCDVSQSQFSKIIRGVRPMNVDQLVVLAEALGLDLGKLVGEVEAFARQHNQYASPVVLVADDGLPYPEPHYRDEQTFDDYAVGSDWRLRQAEESEAARNVDPAELIQAHGTDQGVKKAYDLAAKRGRRIADEQPHAE